MSNQHGRIGGICLLGGSGRRKRGDRAGAGNDTPPGRDARANEYTDAPRSAPPSPTYAEPSGDFGAGRQQARSLHDAHTPSGRDPGRGRLRITRTEAASPIFSGGASPAHRADGSRRNRPAHARLPRVTTLHDRSDRLRFGLRAVASFPTGRPSCRQPRACKRTTTSRPTYALSTRGSRSPAAGVACGSPRTTSRPRRSTGSSLRESTSASTSE